MIMNVFISILTISTIYALTFNKFNAPSTNSFVECSAEECLTTNWPWMDASLPLNTRVNLLVSEMTQEEKVSQLLSTHLYKEDTSSFLKKYGSIGFGVLLPCPRVRKGSISSASQCMQWRNYIQTHFSTKSRLHIPISFREELLHSAGIPGSTVYPMPANLGATWNQSLVTAVYAMVAREARAAGELQLFQLRNSIMSLRGLGLWWFVSCLSYFCLQVWIMALVRCCRLPPMLFGGEIRRPLGVIQFLYRFCRRQRHEDCKERRPSMGVSDGSIEWRVRLNVSA